MAIHRHFRGPIAHIPAGPRRAQPPAGAAPAEPDQQQTYECGIETVGDTWIQFKVQYYIYALVFVVFDIEAVFLFPIAAAFGQLDLFAIGAAVLFIFLLTDGLIYAWSRGVLEWI